MMMEVFIKGLYLLVGLFIGYRVGRRMLGPMEAYLTSAIASGKRVVISVDEKAIMYELVDGKIERTSGYVECAVVDEGDDEKTVVRSE